MTENEGIQSDKDREIKHSSTSVEVVTTPEEKCTLPKQPEPEIILEDSWMIRKDCYDYKDEYKECTSFRGRFHQYFIFGEAIDCNQWKKDYDNCYKWVNKKDIKAGEAMVESEKQRMHKRLRGHYGNTVWRKRDAPPSDWDKPLPEWIAKRDENSYLAIKAKELKGETVAQSDDDKTFCTIM